MGGDQVNIIGKSVIRKDAFEKVTGRAKYTADELAGPYAACQNGNKPIWTC